MICTAESRDPGVPNSRCHDTEPEAPRPLRVMFVTTSMPVGGAETLLVNLIRRIDAGRFAAELCCLKEPGPLGEELSKEVPVHAHLLAGKYDLRVLPRLAKLLRDRKTDVVITVGAGDKMFWGRIAARFSGVPVIASALHSTGWPDRVGRLNHMLTPLTDAFIAVAPVHGQYLSRVEGFPAEKVVVIPNGVDTDRFSPMPEVHALRCELGLHPTELIVTIVAALRPEKHHEMLLHAVALLRQDFPQLRCLIVGDGPRRGPLEQLANQLSVQEQICFLGTRHDVPRLLAASDVCTLCSQNEANPVSILEAMSCARPVVATDVGSVRETVIDGETGYVVRADDVATFASRLRELLEYPLRRQAMGDAARRLVTANWSLHKMVCGYEDLFESLYRRKVREWNSNARRLRLAEPSPTAHN